MINKIHHCYVFLIVFPFVLLVSSAGYTCFAQKHLASTVSQPERIYAVQIAASKVFIDPKFFKQKFKLTEEVVYFQKDGWYKYIIGSYKTEQEAKKKLTSLKMDAFVTEVRMDWIISRRKADPIKEKTVLPKTKVEKAKPVLVKKIDTAQSVALTDSLLIPQDDSLKFVISVSDVRRTYNQKVRSADSAFNLAKDLLKARSIYQEAALILPEKNYPRDQIIEIDKQLAEKQSKTFLSKLPVNIYTIGGCALLVVLVCGIVLIKKLRKPLEERKNFERMANRDREAFIKGLSNGISGTIKATGSGGVVSGSETLIGEIMQLYPNLADVLHGVIGDQVNDASRVLQEVRRCINATDPVLRMEAELAWMRLSKGDPFGFLGFIQEEFSAWEQLHMFEMIKRNKMEVPDFTRWLGSSNASVVIFCKRMIRAFRQGDAYLAEIVEAAVDSEKADTIRKSGINPGSGLDLQSAATRVLEDRIVQ